MRPYYEFLTALEKNNHREWMLSNKSWYQDTREVFLADVADLIKGLSEFVPGMEVFKPKDCVFRINRDVRFSKNKDNFFSLCYSPPAEAASVCNPRCICTRCCCHMAGSFGQGA